MDIKGILQTIIGAFGGASRISKMIAGGVAVVAAVAVKWVNATLLAKYGIALPIPDASIFDGAVLALVMAFIYASPPNSPITK